MDLQQLSIFCTLLSEKSMTEAANRLQITQPTVSRQLKLLEAELGVDLLERETREISPTVQGQLFLDYAQKILNLAKQAQMSIQSLPQHLEGQLRMSTINYLGMSLLAPVMWRFLKPSKQFKINLSYAPARSIIEQMKKDAVDMVILPNLQEEYGIELPNYEKHHLFQDSMIFVGSKKDLSLPSQIQIQDMAKKPLVSFPHLLPKFTIKIEQKQKEHNIQPIFEVNNMGTLKKVIESGLYWGFMPAFSIQKQIQFGRLSEIKVDGIEYSMNIEAYFHKQLNNKKLIDILILMFKRQASFLKF